VHAAVLVVIAAETGMPLDVFPFLACICHDLFSSLSRDRGRMEQKRRWTFTVSAFA
jgi:hypothetical protein